MNGSSSTTLSPWIIDVATSALHAAVNSLPGTTSSKHVNLLTGFILRAAIAGEHDVTVLQTNALSNLQSPPQQE